MIPRFPLEGSGGGLVRYHQASNRARSHAIHDALAHAHRHRGIGATLLDGRQIAVIAHSLRGDHTDAATLLADTVHAEPWQDTVGHVLGLLICRRAGTATPHNAHQLIDPQHAAGQEPATGVFGLEVRLAAVELVDDARRSDMLAELTRTTPVTTDAALARAVLTHPARRHLPASLLDHLTAVHDLATTPTTAESLDNALTDALTGHHLDHHDKQVRRDVRASSTAGGDTRDQTHTLPRKLLRWAAARDGLAAVRLDRGGVRSGNRRR